MKRKMHAAPVKKTKKTGETNKRNGVNQTKYWGATLGAKMKKISQLIATVTTKPRASLSRLRHARNRTEPTTMNLRKLLIMIAPGDNPKKLIRLSC